MTTLLIADAPVTTNGTADVKTDVPNVTPGKAPVPTRSPFQSTGLTEDVVKALTENDDTVTIVNASYTSTKKNGRTVGVKLAVGKGEGWTPVFTAESTHTLARGKDTEYTRILRDACTVRGGTVLAVSIGYKIDALGFRIYNPNPVRAGLDKAFFQMTDEDRRRIDTDYRILANDQQADDFSEVSGYFLVKIRGYRVK